MLPAVFGPRLTPFKVWAVLATMGKGSLAIFVGLWLGGSAVDGFARRRGKSSWSCFRGQRLSLVAICGLPRFASATQLATTMVPPGPIAPPASFHKLPILLRSTPSLSVFPGELTIHVVRVRTRQWPFARRCILYSNGRWRPRVGNSHVRHSAPGVSFGRLVLRGPWLTSASFKDGQRKMKYATTIRCDKQTTPQGI